MWWRFLLEGLFDLRDARVLLHHQEIRFPVLVELADPTEQEAGARVLIAYDGDQFPAAGHLRAPNVTISPSKDEKTLQLFADRCYDHVTRSADRHFRFRNVSAPPAALRETWETQTDD